MTLWTADELQHIAGNDDLHIAPLRDDGGTYGTLTWSVEEDVHIPPGEVIA